MVVAPVVGDAVEQPPATSAKAATDLPSKMPMAGALAGVHQPVATVVSLLSDSLDS